MSEEEKLNLAKRDLLEKIEDQIKAGDLTKNKGKKINDIKINLKTLVSEYTPEKEDEFKILMYELEDQMSEITGESQFEDYIELFDELMNLPYYNLSDFELNKELEAEVGNLGISRGKTITLEELYEEEDRTFALLEDILKDIDANVKPENAEDFILNDILDTDLVNTLIDPENKKDMVDVLNAYFLKNKNKEMSEQDATLVKDIFELVQNNKDKKGVIIASIKMGATLDRIKSKMQSTADRVLSFSPGNKTPSSAPSGGAEIITPKFSYLLKDLVKLADLLDSQGHHKEADLVDQLILKASK